MIDPETRAYLDGEWTVRYYDNPHVGRCAVLSVRYDGDSIAHLSYRNAAHFLTPESVAEYLMELHAEHVAKITLASEAERCLAAQDAWVKTDDDAPLPRFPDEVTSAANQMRMDRLVKGPGERCV
jgi:hypothetical protein